MSKIKRSKFSKDSDLLLNVVMYVTVFFAVVAVVACVIIGINKASRTPSDLSAISETDRSGSGESKDVFSEQSEPYEDNTTLDVQSRTDEPISSDSEQEPQNTVDTDDISSDTSESTLKPIRYDFPQITGNTVRIPTNFIQSRCAILVDSKTNTVIAETASNDIIYPASMTKVMTVIIACENVSDFSVKYQMKAEQIRKAANQGASMAGFWAGDLVTIKDLLYGTILPSGAEAAYALADYVAGSEEKYAALMNKKAHEIGMTLTNFTNVTGLHSDDHYSTVRDIAIMMEYAMNIPMVKEVMSAVTYTTTHGKNLKSVVFNKTDYKHQQYDNGVIMVAGKSGYTPEAAYCLATYYEDRSGNRYILVTSLCSSGNFGPINDARIMIERYIR